MELNTKEIQRRINLTGMSNRVFAKKHGIGGDCLQKWIKGISYPHFDSLKKLAKALRCSIEDIEIDDTQQVMFGDADTAIKAFCAAVDNEMTRRTELTKIFCMTKDCPYNSRGVSGKHFCNAKTIIIQNGQCTTKNGEIPVQE